MNENLPKLIWNYDLPMTLFGKIEFLEDSNGVLDTSAIVFDRKEIINCPLVRFISINAFQTIYSNHILINF